MVKVRKWGNSLGIRIPKAIAEMLSISDGSELELEVRDGVLLLTPRRDDRPDLADLVARIRPGNRHDEIDTGRPRGREVW
ncbi:MAG: AbrB/MazE/SpoVT family DNA-binding domain-containing protein [Planctomycetota bacterium]